jgi:molybdate transport system permease protein
VAADTFDARLAFTRGVLIVSVLSSASYSTLQMTRSLPASFREAAYTLGKSKTRTFFKVLIPNIRPSIITAVALTFAHTIGEFGVVLMVGGNMPGATRVASIAIYDEVQALNFSAANRYALILFIVSFLLLVTIYSVNKKYETWKMI